MYQCANAWAVMAICLPATPGLCCSALPQLDMEELNGQSYLAGLRFFCGISRCGPLFPTPEAPPPLPDSGTPAGIWTGWIGAQAGETSNGAICPCGTVVRVSPPRHHQCMTGALWALALPAARLLCSQRVSSACPACCFVAAVARPLVRPYI